MADSIFVIAGLLQGWVWRGKREQRLRQDLFKIDQQLAEVREDSDNVDHSRFELHFRIARSRLNNRILWLAVIVIVWAGCDSKKPVIKPAVETWVSQKHEDW